MKNLFKTLLYLVLSAGIASLLLAINTDIPYQKKFVYIFLIILLYGWFIYLPFMGICAVILLNVNRKHIAVAFAIGAVLALVLDGSIAQPIFHIVYSGSKLFDMLCFSIGGGIYSILYNSLIHKNRLLPLK